MPRRLARYARERIGEELGASPALAPDAPRCRAPGAAFVSLHWTDGRLHGCVGTIDAHRPLVEDVAANAVAAALYDPRGGALVRADVDALDVEVSILSPLEPLAVADEAAARAALRPHADGVVLRWRSRRATFLPQVWDTLPAPAVFLRELKQKAGLAADFWSADVQLWRYGVERIVDPASRG